MKKVILYCIICLFIRSVNGQQNSRLIPGSPLSPEIQLPAIDDSIKLSNKGAIDIVLKMPQIFFARNQAINVLSTTVKDSGTYLIIYSLTGEDTNTFYPYRNLRVSMDSLANFSVEVNHQTTDEKREFLKKTESPFTANTEYTVRFSSIDPQYSTIKYLKSNDSISLYADMLATTGRGNSFWHGDNGDTDGGKNNSLLSTRLPPIWYGKWMIKSAELILIKIY